MSNMGNASIGNNGDIQITIVSPLNPKVKSTHTFPKGTTVAQMVQQVPYLKDVDLSQWLVSNNRSPVAAASLQQQVLQNGDTVAVSPNAQKVAA